MDPADCQQIMEEVDYVLMFAGPHQIQALFGRFIQVAEGLSSQGLDCGVIDLYRVKPVDSDTLCAALQAGKALVALEENSLVGGIGSLISELLVDRGLTTPMKRIAIADHHCYQYGDRD